MPPKNESVPSQRRSSTELFPEERAELLELLTTHVNSTVERLERSSLADQFEPYAILVGLMGALRAQNPEEGDLEGLVLQRRETLHLRKMVGFEAWIAQKYGGPAPSLESLWQTVRSEAGREVREAKKYRTDKPQIPPLYKAAKDDLQKLKGRINELADERERRSTGLLMEQLKKSMAEIRARRKS